MKATVLIVDDHPVMRQGLRALINQQPEFEVCAEANDAPKAIELAGKHKPVLAIVDIALGGPNGIELTKQLQNVAPETRILILSMHDERMFAARALQAGAFGYVMKEEAGDRVIDALKQILTGRPYLSAPAARDIIAASHRNRSGVVGVVDTLSERELEVFTMLGDGFSTREIADKLGLSVKTIETYRDHLKLKLNVQSGGDLVRYAVQWRRLRNA